MHQFAVYIGVGVFCAAIDIGLMQLLILFKLHYMAATTIGFATGLAINFLLHSRLTFSTSYSHGALARYMLVVIANYTITLSAVALSQIFLDMPIIGKILSLPLVAINGYFLSKHWIYK